MNKAFDGKVLNVYTPHLSQIESCVFSQKMCSAHNSADLHKTPVPRDFLSPKQMFPNKYKYTVQYTGIHI